MTGANGAGGDDFLSEKARKAERKIQAAPWDVDSWNVLLQEAKHQRIQKARKTYEKLVEKFPTCGRYWKIYIEHEMKSKMFDQVEKLFKRCLTSVLNLDLWKTYLTYVRETKEKQQNYREKMDKAYEFALDNIGLDLQSYQIWNDYITFMRNFEVQGSFAENQRITKVRKIYQRGVITPMSNIESLWKDYNTYEQNINALVAKKMIDDRNKEYINARRATKELESFQRVLLKNSPAIPPVGSADERKQLDSWRKYIEWEKSNSLRIEDKLTLTKRVIFAYKQCLLVMGHHPELWYEAAQYLVRMSREMVDSGDMNGGKNLGDQASELYRRATNILMKQNPLIHFAYANFEEGRGKFEKVHQIYTKLTDIPSMDPTLTFIQYMRFARRAEGIKAARQVFRLAREDGRIKFHVFIAAAWMEYYSAKDKNLAIKIFELGLKRFSDKPEYVRQYMDFMSNMNDDNNTRVLYERVLTEDLTNGDKMESVWNKYLEFECNVGDLQSMQKVENRRIQKILHKTDDIDDPNKKIETRKESALLIDRYRFLDLFPCTKEELRSMGYKDSSGIQNGDNTNSSSKDKNMIQLDDEVDAFCRPDRSQMIPFKPRRFPAPGSHPVQGGEYPMPEAAHNILKLMPPPVCFHGPFVRVDDLIEKFRSTDLPEKAEWLKLKHTTSKGTKRGIDKDESGANDIFRQRQQKRANR